MASVAVGAGADVLTEETPALEPSAARLADCIALADENGLVEACFGILTTPSSRVPFEVVALGALVAGEACLEAACGWVGKTEGLGGATTVRGASVGSSPSETYPRQQSRSPCLSGWPAIA